MKKNNPQWGVTGVDSLGRPVYSKVSQSKDIPQVSQGVHIDPGAQSVVNVLHQHGLKPMLVGGCVRDSILGLESKDVDIEVYGAQSMEEVSHIMSTVARVDPVGQSFGVLKVMSQGEDIDVSLPRRDSLADGGNTHRSINAEVDPTMTIEEASTRRDFTINAIAYNPITNSYVDPHGGMDDLEDGILRLVDEGTFGDDPLRVLRGVQFAGRFDMEMDEDTIEVCSSMTHEGLAKERIAGEFHKLLLKSTNLHRGIDTLHQVGWDRAVPSIDCTREPIDQGVVNKIYGHNPTVTMGLVAALVDYHYGSGNGDVAKEMMLTGPERRVFNDFPLDRGGDQIYMSRMIRSGNHHGVSSDVVRSMVSTQVSPAPDLWSGNSPEPYQVTGKTLIDMGLKPGPEFKRILSTCQDINDSGRMIDSETLRGVINGSVDSS